MLKPKVSVIVPIYNAEAFLERCLNGICEQTLKEIEIICVDDGSTDGSAQILEDCAKQDSRIHIIHQENKGAGAARNAGLDIAQGEYLSFLDADDFFEPNMLEKAYTQAQSGKLDVVVFRSDTYYPESDRFETADWTIHTYLLPSMPNVFPFSRNDIDYDIFMAFVGWTWDKLFRTSFIRKNKLRFQEIRTTNDMYFTFSAIVRARRIEIIDEILVHHAKEEGSLSVTREQSWGCFYEALCALRDQLKEWHLFGRKEQDFINYSLHATLWNYNTLAEPTKTLLAKKLIDEWYSDLGISQHDESYFYNKGEYADYRKLVENCCA